MIKRKTTKRHKTLKDFEGILSKYKTENAVRIISDLDEAGLPFHEILYQFKKPMIFNQRNITEKFFSYIKQYPRCFLYVLVSIAKENYVEKRFWPYLFEAFHLKNINEGFVETRIRELVTGFLNSYGFLQLFPESERIVDIFGIVAHAKVPTAYYDLYSNFIGNLFDLVENEDEAVKRLKLWRELYQKGDYSKRQTLYIQEKDRAITDLAEIFNALSKDHVIESSLRMMRVLKTQPALARDQRIVSLLKKTKAYFNQRSQLISDGLSQIEMQKTSQREYNEYKRHINRNNLNVFYALKKPMRYFLLFGEEYAESFLIESLSRIKQSNKKRSSPESPDVHDYTKKRYAIDRKQNFNLSSTSWEYSLSNGVSLKVGKIRIDEDFRKQYQATNKFWVVIKNTTKDFEEEFFGGFIREGIFVPERKNRLVLDNINPKDIFEIIIRDIYDKEYFISEPFTLTEDYCVFYRNRLKFKQLKDDYFPGKGELYIWHTHNIRIEAAESTYHENDQVTILQNKYQDEIRIFDVSFPDEPVKILRRLDSLNPNFDQKGRINGLSVDGEVHVYNAYPEVRFNEYDKLKNWRFKIDDGELHEIHSHCIDLSLFCSKKRSLYSLEHFRKYNITFLNNESQEHKEKTFFLFPEFSFDLGNQVFSRQTEKMILKVTSQKIANFQLSGQHIRLNKNISSHEKSYEYTVTDSDFSTGTIGGVLACKGDLTEKKEFRIQFSIPFLDLFEKEERLNLMDEWLSFDKLTELSVQTNRDFNIMKIGLFKAMKDSKALTYLNIDINKKKRFVLKEIESKRSLLPLEEPVYLHVKFFEKFKNATSYTMVCKVIKETEDEEW